jgi:tetratricopeptide (TPR) repeat protein/CHAT domain-containing protein
MRKYLLHILIISIFSLILFTCPFAYTQSHKLADEYWDKAQELRKQGKYLDAAVMYEKCVEAEKVSPAPRVEELAKALSEPGYCYYLVGKYDKAIKCFKEALAIDKKLGVEADVARDLNNIGVVYSDWGQYDKALKYYEEALAIDKRLGQEADVAIRLNNIGMVYNSWGQYDKAIKHFKEALAIAEKLGQEGSVATCLNNIGDVYHSLGKYDKALEYYEESLAIKKKLGQEEGDVATSLNNIGAVYHSLGKYDKAIKNFKEVLAIYKKLELEGRAAVGLNNIGFVYHDWGQYDKALKYYKEALAIDKRLGQEAGVAVGLNNIGKVYSDWGQYDKALKYYEEALAIDKRLGEEADIGLSLNNIGGVYDDWGQSDKAIKYYEEALAIARKLGMEADVATYLNNIGGVYHSLGQYDKAIKNYEEALVINKRLGREAGVARCLNNIGGVYYLQGKYKTATKFLIDSISIKEKLRKTATGDVRRDYLASQLGTYQLLTSVYIRYSDFPSAYQTVELSRAKLLAERLAGDESKIRLPDVKQIQDTLDEDTVVLVYANVNWGDIVQIAITKEGITGKEVSNKSFVKSSIDKYDKPIKTLLGNQRGITVIKKDQKDNLLSDKTETKSDFDNIINYYRSLLKSPSSQDDRGVKVIAKEPKENQVANTKEIGKELYKLLIKPMEWQIKGKKNIIVVPDGVLAFVPFETLIDEEEEYLVEDFHVSYVQSMSIREFISERQYKKDRKPLLAFGGAVYDEVSYGVDTIENGTQLALLTRSVYTDLEEKRSVRNAYGALGVGTWNNLPGTLSEVRNIKNVIKRADVFTGSNVTEKGIKEFSNNGKLSKYKVIHFATHGLVVPEVPELSAVVLSQFENERGKEDGYLRMGEIAELDIKADFVNLSACETGLGKIYGGEGVVGLTQSFLLAGANAVSVSLWMVADESTSQFMVSMYDRVQDKDISYAVAMTEVKRRFINGVFGEKYKSPCFWAPFVYYGKDYERTEGEKKYSVEESNLEEERRLIEKENYTKTTQHVTLRSSYKTLSVSQAQSVPNMSIREKVDWGFFGHGTINHDYNLKSISGDKVVIDHATGLMWHQNGSSYKMNCEKPLLPVPIVGRNTKKWFKKLNKKGYAGYHDWRLPTVEEAASLLESSVRSGDLYIDPVFSNKQIYIWTGDRYGSKGAWYLDCYAGAVGWTSIWHDTFVRPVRSME